MLGCETLVGMKSFGQMPVSIWGQRKPLARRCLFPHHHICRFLSLLLSRSLFHTSTHTHAQTNTHPHTNTHTSDHPCYFTPQVKRGADIRNKFRKWQRTEETCYIYQSNPLHRFSIFLPLCSVLPLNVTTSMTVIITYSSSMFSLCEMTSTPITAY